MIRTEGSGGDNFDFLEASRQELQRDREIASAFAAACRSGDVDAFKGSVEMMAFACDGWRLAMLKSARLPAVSDDIRAAFLSLWIQHKHIPLAVGHRPTTARALRVLMPRTPVHTTGIHLYRGAGMLERRRRIYGFSWTKDVLVAREFAARQQPGEWGAVILETHAPADAVLHVRNKEDFYDEDEVVVDPYRLGRVGVQEKLPPIQSDVALAILGQTGNSVLK